MMRIFILFAAILVGSSSVKAQLYFPPNGSLTWDTIQPSSLGWCQERIDSLYGFLENSNSKAFILLKDGKIVLEQYFNGQTPSDSWYWASAGKTITSFMVGVAQQENYLSISDTTSDYLGAGWTSCTPSQEEKITIRHQLTMTSGLDDGVSDPTCMDDTCLVYLADAGSRWAYHNAPYTLLDDVISVASGQNLNTYTTQKLKTPTGMDGLFVSVGNNNVFYSTPRSMARFGLLILNEGNWDGTPVMTDTAYYNQMVNTSQNLNESYGYLWWLNGKNSFMIPQTQFVFPGSMNPNAPADMFAAMGKNGQCLNVIPSQNMVWLRMGNPPDSSNSLVSVTLNNDIWDYINQLSCPVTVSDLENDQINVYPNPVTNECRIQMNTNESGRLELYDFSGKLVYTLNTNTNELYLDMSEYPAGMYFIKVVSGNRILSERIIKN